MDSKGNVSLIEFETANRKVVIVDSVETEDEKKTVTVIGSNVFDGNTQVKEVTVGKNIKVTDVTPPGVVPAEFLQQKTFSVSDLGLRKQEILWYYETNGGLEVEQS